MTEETTRTVGEAFGLAGRTAIVTGGAQGIGRAVAEAYARAGADIVIGDILYEKAEKTCSRIEANGVRAVPVKCDVSRTADADNLVRTAVAEFGKIDVLVNNAGISGAAEPIVRMTDEDWERTLAINLSGMFKCSRACAIEMIKQKSGKIINITSVASYRPVANSGDYCASKGGALMLTKVLALELVKYNIHVNAICPGMFDTNLAPQLKEAVMKNPRRMIPLGRIAGVDEIQGLALFLASPASDYLVGAAIPIDGGISVQG